MKQHGFSGSEVMLVLAVVLAIGGIGSYLYTKHAHSPNKPASSTTSSTASNGKSTSPGGIPGGASGAAAQPAAGPSGTVIKVSEGGFSITVPDSLKDLTYHANGGVISFSTASLTAATAQCSANNQSGGGAFDTITHGYGVYKPPANAANGGLLKQYDGYYLSYTLPTGPCAKGLSPATQSLLDEQAQAFYGALSTVKSL